MKKNAIKPKKKPVPAPTRAAPPMLHARWVQHLLLLGHSHSAIRVLLLNDDLPAPNDEILRSMLVALDVPTGFKPRSTTHARSFELIDRLGLAPFFRTTPEAKQALKILRNARARELVEAGVLLGVPLPAVVTILGTHLRAHVTEAALALYSFAFLDVSTVARSQLKVLVQARVRQAVMRVVGDADADGPSARRAIGADARMLAVSMSASPLGWGAVLMAMGIAPARQELSKILAELERVAATRAAQALIRGGADDERRAEGFTGVLRSLRQIHEGAPDDVMGKSLAQFTLRHDETPMVTVADLRARGDDFTADVVPLEHAMNGDAAFGDESGDFDAASGET